MDTVGETQVLLGCVGEVLRQREVRRAFDTASHLTIAGTSSASPFIEKLQEKLLFLGDAIAPHAMDLYPKYTLSAPIRSKNLLVVRGAFYGERVAIFGRPRCKER